MFKKLFLFSCLSLSLSTLSLAKPKSYNGLVVFGDSLSDIGNACPKEGKQSFLLCPLYSNERFSDGKLWVEHLADKLKLKLSPSLDGGYNFAFGGAKSGWGTEAIPGLRTQVDRYLRKVGDKANDSALYVVWIGGNDFKDAFTKLSLNFEKLMFKDLLDDITDNIKRLSRKGAKEFLVPNMPPIHKSPLATGILEKIMGVWTGLSWMVIDMDSEDFSSVGSPQNPLDLFIEGIIGHYNFNLARRLHLLEKEFKIKIYHPNVFHAFKELSENYKSLGLSSPEELFCFDKFHPSAKGHIILANEMLSILHEEESPLLKDLL